MSTEILQQLNNQMADTIERVRGSLVQISNGRGAGAGTIWHSDGLIITNAHVVRGRDHLKVTLPDGHTLPAQLIAMNVQLDLAALSVDAVDLPTIEIGDSRRLKPGQWVMAIGHPWGIHGAVTSGLVIGFGGQRPEMQPGREWIALDLHMRPGHSGGPLVDAAGRLVGINTMITGPDVGFAIPVQVVKTFLKETIGAQKLAV
jgi:S1-C subfamily serine protease